MRSLQTLENVQVIEGYRKKIILLLLPTHSSYKEGKKVVVYQVNERILQSHTTHVTDTLAIREKLTQKQINYFRFLYLSTTHISVNYE